MAKKNAEMSKQLIENIGGKDNILTFVHCTTRLRFTVKDKSVVNEVEVNNVKGVIGTQWLGEQYQVIVGAEVDDIYHTICSMYGFERKDSVDENLDEDLKKGFSLKKIGNAILAYTSPAMTGVIPIMMAVCMCKMFVSVFGSGMLGIIPDDSDLFFVLNMMYNTFFYFMPVFLGYSAAKALNVNPVYGIFCGTVILVPDFVALVGIRESISVFGLPAPVAAYGQSFLPVIIGVWIMSYIIKLLNKFIPSVIKSIFVPFFTIVVMTVIMLCVCAPIGSWLGTILGNFFIMFAEANVVLRVAGGILLAVLMPYMVLGGMHGVLVNFAIMTWSTNGFETFTLPIMFAYNFAVFGMALGAMLKVKKAETRATMSTYFLSGILGSVTEPILFGITVKYKKALKSLMIVCALIGLYVGLFTPVYYNMSSATIFTFFIPYTSGTTVNLVSGVVLTAIAFFGAALTSYIMVDYGED